MNKRQKKKANNKRFAELSKDMKVMLMSCDLISLHHQMQAVVQTDRSITARKLELKKLSRRMGECIRKIKQYNLNPPEVVQACER